MEGIDTAKSEEELFKSLKKYFEDKGKDKVVPDFVKESEFINSLGGINNSGARVSLTPNEIKYLIARIKMNPHLKDVNLSELEKKLGGNNLSEIRTQFVGKKNLMNDYKEMSSQLPGKKKINLSATKTSIGKKKDENLKKKEANKEAKRLAEEAEKKEQERLNNIDNKKEEINTFIKTLIKEGGLISELKKLDNNVNNVEYDINIEIYTNSNKLKNINSQESVISKFNEIKSQIDQIIEEKSKVIVNFENKLKESISEEEEINTFLNSNSNKLINEPELKQEKDRLIKIKNLFIKFKTNLQEANNRLSSEKTYIDDNTLPLIYNAIRTYYLTKEYNKTLESLKTKTNSLNKTIKNKTKENLFKNSSLIKINNRISALNKDAKYLKSLNANLTSNIEKITELKKNITNKNVYNINNNNNVKLRNKQYSDNKNSLKKNIQSYNKQINYIINRNKKVLITNSKNIKSKINKNFNEIKTKIGTVKSHLNKAKRLSKIKNNKFNGFTTQITSLNNLSGTIETLQSGLNKSIAELNSSVSQSTSVKSSNSEGNNTNFNTIKRANTLTLGGNNYSENKLEKAIYNKTGTQYYKGSQLIGLRNSIKNLKNLNISEKYPGNYNNNKFKIIKNLKNNAKKHIYEKIKNLPNKETKK